jgi:hypothetical protein
MAAFRAARRAFIVPFVVAHGFASIVSNLKPSAAHDEKPILLAALRAADAFQAIRVCHAVLPDSADSSGLS